jgi:RNA polymerase sigma factor (sigma-70 family)
LSDAELLTRFRGQADEAAFALLVQRHGPMVLGVCRRLLKNATDADDAFQATFLVLVRAASVVRKQASLASWLYGVAQRTVGKARSRVISLQAREQRGAAMRLRESHDPSEALSRQDLRVVLDEEQRRLPERYRTPLILCYLEGKEADLAARELGVPRGTLSSRLTKGRAILRDRLKRRGVTPAGSLLAGLIAHQATAAPVPASLTLATVRAASCALGGKTLAGQAFVVATQLAAGVSVALRLGARSASRCCRC